MNIDDITKLIMLILAISLASERLVTFLKTLIPALADKTQGQPVPPKSDNRRQVIVMLIAFLASLLTSVFLAKQPVSFPYLEAKIELGGSIPSIPVYLMALLASGGSAFWTNLLGYTKAVKDIKKEQTTQEKKLTENVLQGKQKAL